MRFLVAALSGALMLCTSAAEAQTAPPTLAELVYIPLPPCRAFNFLLAQNHAALIGIAGTQSLESIGGSKTGCGVPFSAAAVSITLRGLLAPAPGYVTAWAPYTPRPGTVTVNYQASASSAAGSIVGMAGGGIQLYSSQAVRVVGDVNGYFDYPIAGTVGVVAGGGSASPVAYGHHMVSISRSSIGQYAIVVDRDITSCAAQATPIQNNAQVIYVHTAGNAVYASVNNINFKFQQIEPVDSYFNLSVHC